MKKLFSLSILRFKSSSARDRSKLVGQRISELRKSSGALTEDQRVELGKQAEVELKTGLELPGRDKKIIQDLIALVRFSANSRWRDGCSS